MYSYNLQRTNKGFNSAMIVYFIRDSTVFSYRLVYGRALKFSKYYPSNLNNYTYLSVFMSYLYRQFQISIKSETILQYVL